jgi:cell fate (sporulation/competence/biofilm development) regulator YlbF (YheA/YmcA/DUF963 family)
MADHDDLIAQARSLGESLAKHPRVTAFFSARQAVDANPAAGQLLREYTTHMQKLQQLSAMQQPIEVADKHKAKELEGKLAGDECIRGFMRAQADYLELMHNVNTAMEEPVAAAMPGRPS